MKKELISFLLATLFASGYSTSSAQLSQIANRIPDLIQPALSGSMRYKGFVEVSGTGGLGSHRANFVGIATSQGFQYSTWFFMGAGIGVDLINVNGLNDSNNYHNQYPSSDHSAHNTSTTKVMIPLYSDFRFNIGGMDNISVFLDIKAGASWLIGDSYLDLNGSYLGNTTQFYLKPSIGIRIPVDSNNKKKALDLGVTYQLITSDRNYYYWNRNTVTLNNLGITVGYEW